MTVQDKKAKDLVSRYTMCGTTIGDMPKIGTVRHNESWKRKMLTNHVEFRNRWATVVMTLVFVPLFFGGTLSLPSVVTVACDVFAVVAAFVYSSFGRIKCGFSGYVLPISCFYIFTLLNNNQLLQHGMGVTYYVSVACVAIITLISRGGGFDFSRALVRVAIFLSLIHAIATIVLCIFPAICAMTRGALELNIGDYTAGITNHYSTNAIFIATGLVLAFPLLFKVGLAKRNRMLVTLGILSIALVLTSKRAHLAFAVLVCIVVYAIISKDELGSAVFKIGVAITGMLATVLLFSQLVPSLGLVVTRFLELGSDDTFGGRSDFYRICFQLWEQSPVVGNGWSSFSFALNSTPTGQQLQGVGINLMSAHNVFYQLLAEEGVVGLSLFVGSMIAVIRASFCSYFQLRANSESQDSALALSCLALQLFFVLYCATGNPLYDTICIIPFLLSISCTQQLREISKANQKGHHCSHLFAGVNSLPKKEQ